MNFKENYTQNEISLKLTDESHINKLLDYSLTKKFYRYLEYKPFKKKEAEIYFKKKIKSKKIILFSIFYKKKNYWDFFN